MRTLLEDVQIYVSLQIFVHSRTCLFSSGETEKHRNGKVCRTSGIMNGFCNQDSCHMRKNKSEGPASTNRRVTSCRYCSPEPECSDDAELKQLTSDLARALFRVMEHQDADILARYEVRGQSLSEIAQDIGCSRSDAIRRLNHAQRCLCELVILTLSPRKPE